MLLWMSLGVDLQFVDQFTDRRPEYVGPDTAVFSNDLRDLGMELNAVATAALRG